MELQHGLICVFLLFANGVFSENVPGNSQPTPKENVAGMEALFARMVQMEAEVSKQQVELTEVKMELRATRAQLEDTRTETSEEIANLRKEFGVKMADIETEHKKEVDALKARVELFEAAETVAKEWNERYETVEDTEAVADESGVEEHGSKLKSAIKKTFKRHAQEAPITKARRQENVPRAAFFAKLSNNTKHLGYNQPIIFDNVTTNIGNNYDSHVGMFRAPADGVYLFSTSITSYSSSSGHFGFFINDGRETWFYNNGNQNGWDESSQTIVVQLNRGDDVTVRSLEADHSVTGYDYSVFSGVLLFEDNPDSVIIGLPVPKARRQGNDAKVAFFAKLSANTEHFGYNQPIIFDNVTTNVGNNYDKHVGVFRAPVAGVYLFSTTITSFSTNSGHFGIFINEGRETWFYNNGNQNAWDETSQTIIVHLDQGDDVTVRSLDTDHGVTGFDHSLLSGLLLFEDNSESIIVGK